LRRGQTLNAHDVHAFVGAIDGDGGETGCSHPIPDFHRGIFATAVEVLTIGSKDQRRHLIGMALQMAHIPPALPPPEHSRNGGNSPVHPDGCWLDVVTGRNCQSRVFSTK
jgi:hypothetical protein